MGQTVPNITGFESKASFGKIFVNDT